MITPLPEKIIVTTIVYGEFSFKYPQANEVADNRSKINEIITYLNRKLPDDNISSWNTIAAEWKKIAKEALAELKALKEAKKCEK